MEIDNPLRDPRDIIEASLKESDVREREIVQLRTPAEWFGISVE